MSHPYERPRCPEPNLDALDRIAALTSQARENRLEEVFDFLSGSTRLLPQSPPLLAAGWAALGYGLFEHRQEQIHGYANHCLSLLGLRANTDICHGSPWTYETLARSFPAAVVEAETRLLMWARAHEHTGQDLPGRFDTLDELVAFAASRAALSAPAPLPLGRGRPNLLELVGLDAWNGLATCGEPATPAAAFPSNPSTDALRACLERTLTIETGAGAQLGLPERIDWFAFAQDVEASVPDVRQPHSLADEHAPF